MSDKEFIAEELRMLYQITVTDLSYFKSQQWSVTNYSLALMAGLIGITQFIKPLTCIDCIILTILLSALTLGSIIVLYKLQNSIKVRQSRLEATRSNFSMSFLNAWAAETKGVEYLHAIYFLYSTIICGFTVAIWLINFRLINS